jgi:hypothetical protein
MWRNYKETGNEDVQEVVSGSTLHVDLRPGRFVEETSNVADDTHGRKWSMILMVDNGR